MANAVAVDGDEGLASRLRVERAGLTLAAGLFCAVVAAAGSARAAGETDAETFWQLERAEPAAREANTVHFIRVRATGDTIELLDACDALARPKATASIAADGAWSFGATYGGLQARRLASGRLEWTLDGKVWATARAVQPFTCDNGVPRRVAFASAAGPVRPAPRPMGQGSAMDAVGTGDAAHLEAALHVALPSQRPPPLPTVVPQPDSTTTLANGDLRTCRSTPTSLSGVRTLQGLPALGSNGQVWPGALLQGRPYAQGRFAPITIPRAGGTVTVSGVNFASSAAVSSLTAPEMSGPAVLQGIAQLLAQKVAGTEAQFDFRVDRVYGADQLAYSLGVDGRFLNGLDGALALDAPADRSLVLARFRQTYYTASFEAPELRTSVFKAGSGFADPENQIGADNPPLYVSDVGFGRVIYFVVASAYDADAVIEALQSTGDRSANADTVGRAAPASFGQILRESSISYFVQGGDSIAELGAMGRLVGVADQYEAVRKAIVDARAAQVTDFGKGVPVTYTLNYLADRTTASMGFATAYDDRVCTTVTPRRYASYSLGLYCIDDSATISLLDPAGREIAVFQGSGTPRNFLLDTYIPDAQKDQTFVLRLQDNNIAGPSCLDFQLLRWDHDQGKLRAMALAADGRSLVSIELQGRTENPPPPDPLVRTGGSWLVGTVADYRIRINRGSGEVTVIQGN